MPVKVSTRTVASPAQATAFAAPPRGLAQLAVDEGCTVDIPSVAAADQMTPAHPKRRSGLLRTRLTTLQKSLAASNPVTQSPAPSPAAVNAPPSEAFPTTRLLDPSHDSERDLRLPREMEVLSLDRQIESLRGEFREQPGSDYETFNGIQQLSAKLELLKEAMERDFVPKHGQFQLISPNNFFVDRLFHVKSRSVPRAPELEFPLDANFPDGPRYVGPELRQSDGLVFMALLNLCRDYRVGKQACFNVAHMTTALWDSYNGQLRQLLKETIRRLQRATIECPDFTVQLVQRFDHPRRGEWSVALDQDIVRLFRLHEKVWLDLPLRKRLSEGLSTWLYGYVRSQSRMIPWRIDDLRNRCGSEANDKTFREMLGKALRQLVQEGIIDSGWSFKGHRVHWRKPPNPAAPERELPAPKSV